MCQRCVRFSNEIAQDEGLLIDERGAARLSILFPVAVRQPIFGQHRRNVSGRSFDLPYLPFQGPTLGIARH